jgi:hypothetical protein
VLPPRFQPGCFQGGRPAPEHLLHVREHQQNGVNMQTAIMLGAP